MAYNSPQRGGLHGSPRNPNAQHRPPFEEYVTQDVAERKIRDGEAVEGTLKVTASNYRISFVAGGVNGRDICVPSYELRNRAMDGDLVVVEKLPRDLWGIDQKKAQALGIDVFVDAAEQRFKSSASVVEIEDLLQKLSIKPRELFAADRSPTVLALESAEDAAALQANGLALELYRRTKSPSTLPDSVLQTHGKVIFIKSKVHPRVAIGAIKTEGRTTLFVPTDSKFPRMLVNSKCLPAEYRDKPLPDNLLLTCTLGDWPASSFYAHAGTVEVVGLTSSLEACSRALLKKHNVDTRDFTAEECSTLPPAPWAPTAEELAARRDFRDTLVFSIDPPTTRDVDDALSIVELPDGTFEIGVHIADVSHFVREGTALDLAARKRATTTYMIRGCYPMLPRQLCDELCSLLGNVDRYTFSVVFHMRAGEEPRPVWMGKSIIRSAAKLAYAHAQSVISGKFDLPFPEIPAPHTLQHVHTAIARLHTLAQQLRSKRFADGALGLHNGALHFNLDPAIGMPASVSLAEHNEAHELIEEFMLLANIAVAERLFKAYPVGALLRKHPAPDEEMLSSLATMCQRLHLELESSSSLGLNDSLQRCPEPVRAGLSQSVTRSMKLAEYFASMGDQEKAMHFGLHVALYTHFTSPIRRYADLMVHRQLQAALAGQELPVPVEEVAAVSQTCNERSKAANSAQDDEEKLYLAAFIKAQPPPVQRDAIITAISDRSVEVFVPEFNLVVRADCDPALYESFLFNEDSMTMSLTPKGGAPFVVRLYEAVRTELAVQGTGINVQIVPRLVPPPAAPADERQGHVAGQL